MMMVMGVLRIFVLSCTALSSASSKVLRRLDGEKAFYMAGDIPFLVDSSSRSTVA